MMTCRKRKQALCSSLEKVKTFKSNLSAQDYDGVCAVNIKSGFAYFGNSSY